MASERILAVGTIVAGGEIDWHISPLTGDIEVSDADIQRMIDEAADTDDLEDYLADVDWLRSGC